MNAIDLQLVARALMCASAAIVLALGTLHLVYKFRGRKLEPVGAATIEAMRSDRLRITSQTTVWNAWIGFNASHSLGAMLFGVVFGYLAAFRFALLQDSPFLQAVSVAFLLGLAILAKRFWFRVPLAGVAIALGAQAAGVAAMHA